MTWFPKTRLGKLRTSVLFSVFAFLALTTAYPQLISSDATWVGVWTGMVLYLQRD